jgi:glycosyltransferase involved in cell wall biosynthesis
MTNHRHHFAIIGSRGFPSTYGGFETFVRHLAPFLVEHGHAVTVYCHEKDDMRRTRWIDQDTGVTCQTTRGFSNKSLATLTHGAAAIGSASQRRFSAVLVLNVAHGFYMPLLRAAGVPSVVNVDGLEWERGKWNAIGKRVFRFGAELTARYAETLVFDSMAIAEHWRTTLGADGVYIPYGGPVPSEPLGKARVQALGLRPGTYALAVGRLVPENNIDVLVEGMQEFAPDIPTVIVGGNPHGRRLTRLLHDATANPRSRLHWLGHINDQALLSELWANCGVYYHGHSVGGTNPALLQAMGHGSPVLAIDTPYSREVLASDEHLIIRDPQTVAERIREIVNNPGLRGRLSESGRTTIRQRYNWQVVCEAYKELLERSAARSVVASEIPKERTGR